MSGQDQYGDYDYTRRGNQAGEEYEGQQDYNGRGGEAAGYGGRAGTPGYGNRRAEGAHGRGGEAGAYGGRGAEQAPQTGEYGQAGEYGNREYRSYRRGEYRPRSDYGRGGESARGEYGRRPAGEYGAGGGGEPPRSRRDVIGVIASSLFAVLAVLALVFVIYMVVQGRGPNDDPSTSVSPTNTQNSPTDENTPTDEPTPTVALEQAPVIVLNSTDTSGLAGKVDKQLADAGWETGEPANYDGNALAATTVFYPDGLEGSAQLLQQEFADIAEIKPAEANMSTESLTLVIGSDWPT